VKGLWTISSTQGHIFQAQNWTKDGNKTGVDILKVNWLNQEGVEKNYRLKPCRAKCLRTEF